MTLDRRGFVAGGIGLLAFQVGGLTLMRTARAARAEQLPYRILTAEEAVTLDGLGETLLPGATEAGLTHYVDQQLAAPAAESLLMLRYLDVPPPYAPFYRAGLAAIDGASRQAYTRSFAALNAVERDEFVRHMQQDAHGGWQGPPASLLYFVLRSDAVDAVYGTAEGFAKLGVPYMPHIMPPTPW